MTADDVLFVLTLLRKAKADVWIGGWGIDSLIGEQT
ncbi:nucleotidyltransferase domain-containing protein [Streptomyces mirabilis]